MAMMLRQAISRAALRRGPRAAAVTARAFLSTNPSAENNDFLKGFSEEQAQRALQRSAEIRAQHFAAKDSFPASRCVLHA
jgi:hypothetical protein